LGFIKIYNTTQIMQLYTERCRGKGFVYFETSQEALDDSNFMRYVTGSVALNIRIMCERASEIPHQQQY
jgi:hypothetical protein